MTGTPSRHIPNKTVFKVSCEDAVVEHEWTSRSDRLDARRIMLQIATRHMASGGASPREWGSTHKDIDMGGWAAATKVIGVEYAVGGGNAANSYMEPQYTEDLDLVLALADLEAAKTHAQEAGWTKLGPIHLDFGMEGSAWATPGGLPVDLLGLPMGWGGDALAAARSNILNGLPTLTRPYIMFCKIIASRLKDMGPLAKMAGGASASELALFRDLVRRWCPDEIDDMNQIILLGQHQHGNR